MHQIAQIKFRKWGGGGGEILSQTPLSHTKALEREQWKMF